MVLVVGLMEAEVKGKEVDVDILIVLSLSKL